MNREQLKLDFLAQTEWADARLDAIGSDASKRSYDRVILNGKSAILMNAPFEAGEDIRPFVHVTNILRQRGFSAPEIYAQDDQNGFLLLEDFGNDLFASLAGSDDGIEKQLYTAAIEMLVKLHAEPAADLPKYDTETYLNEAALVTDWYMPNALGHETDATLRDGYLDLVKDILPITESQVITLRDFHAENLIWLPDRSDTSRVGLLDYQDALAGHPAYDLVSLLEDARRDTSKTLQSEMLDLYVQKSGCEEADFKEAYAALGAQRNLKIVGIFARLCCRDGKTHYPDLIPRVWGHLQQDLKYPKLYALRDWVDEYVPPPTPETLQRIKDNHA